MDDTFTEAANEWKESDVRKVKVALCAGMATGTGGVAAVAQDEG